MPFHSDLSPGLLRRKQYAEYIRNRNKNRYRINYNRYYDNFNGTNINYDRYYDRYYEQYYEQLYSEYDHVYSNSIQLSLYDLFFNTKIKINEKNDLFCPICQNAIKTNTEIIRELGCSHVFHLDCIDKWLLMKNQCPLCKKNI